MKKNPIVAAVLNFLLFGGGTVYVGKRKGGFWSKLKEALGA